MHCSILIILVSQVNEHAQMAKVNEWVDMQQHTQIIAARLCNIIIIIASQSHTSCTCVYTAPLLKEGLGTRLILTEFKVESAQCTLNFCVV